MGTIQFTHSFYIALEPVPYPSSVLQGNNLLIRWVVTSFDDSLGGHHS